MCQPGFRNTHVREDPERRLHGQLGRCTGPAQPLEVALDQKTQFATPGGLHLLYNPEALDRLDTPRLLFPWWASPRWFLIEGFSWSFRGCAWPRTSRSPIGFRCQPSCSTISVWPPHWTPRPLVELGAALPLVQEWCVC